MKKESTRKTITVAFLVCLVCSVLVSATAVGLRSIQKKNQELDKIKNILSAGGLNIQSGDVQKIYEDRIRPRLLNLSSGQFVDESEFPEGLTPQNFDMEMVVKSEEYTTALDPANDPAKIQRLPKWTVVYEVLDGESISRYIFPVVGKGLWSTMFGFLALDNDFKTLQGLTFYEHGETPGLGGEVDNPLWKQLWVDRPAYDEQGNLRIQVIKGTVDDLSPKAKYQIDGLSGSTLTTRGVNDLIRFWLGEKGYGKWIQMNQPAMEDQDAA